MYVSYFNINKLCLRIDKTKIFFKEEFDEIVANSTKLSTLGDIVFPDFVPEFTFTDL